MKKVLSIVLSIVMVLCMMPAMAFADSAAYSDIAGTKCEAAVETLAELGVVDGYPDGTYKPEGVVTRAEMAKLIVTALGLNPTAGTSAFTDMDAAKWAIPYVGYAESLGIIEGYGNGLFGPNDTVTYDQAITMVVRALGYTEACNEMQGEWPAVFVLKANALGLLKDVATGATGATRGDVAVLLDNALDVPMVYADNEGATKFVTADKDTMAKLLTKDAYAGFGTVTATDVEGAAKNVREFLGAAGKIVKNEKLEVISVSDVKTTFLTGTFASGSFKTVDDVTYKVTLSTVKNALNAEGKAVTVGTTVPAFVNGAAVADASIASLTSGTYTIAATVDGNRITGIFSVQQWTTPAHDKVAKADLDQITINQTLLGESFALDKNDAIDTNSFILKGVDSLADIAADNVVFVYSTAGAIKKVEVGTKVVSGEVTKQAGTKYFINGDAYEIASTNDSVSISVGDKITAYLDYTGKIYSVKAMDGTAGNYAVVLATNGQTPAKGTFAPEAKVQVFTAEGAKTLTAANVEFVDNAGEWVTTAGAIVNIAVDEAGKLVDMTSKEAFTTSSKSALVSKQGLFDGKKIADNALIITVPTSGASFVYTDATKIAVVEKAALLGKTIACDNYVVNPTTGEIVCMVISDAVTATDAEYGIITSVATLTGGKKEVSFFVNSSKVEKATTKADVSKATHPALYAITKDAAGLYAFGSTSAKVVDTINCKATMAGIFVKGIDIDQDVAGLTAHASEAAIYSDAIVYVYDESAETFTVGTVSNLLSNDVTKITFYATAANDKADSYGTIDYIVVTKA